jgi:hypothetical protein
MARGVGIALIVLGLVSSFFGEIPYSAQTHHLAMGPMTVDVKERKAVPMPRVAGLVAVAAGVVLLVSTRKSREP